MGRKKKEEVIEEIENVEEKASKKEEKVSNKKAETKKRKVYGETAIPTGIYNLKLSYSNKFANRAWGKKYKGQVPELLDVKGFVGIRIHPLNTTEDSLGCIGVGKNSVVGMITNSTEYYYKLMNNYIIPAIKRNEKITIEIK